MTVSSAARPKAASGTGRMVSADCTTCPVRLGDHGGNDSMKATLAPPFVEYRRF
jgi:hypothetical protein